MRQKGSKTKAKTQEAKDYRSVAGTTTERGNPEGNNISTNVKH